MRAEEIEGVMQQERQNEEGVFCATCAAESIEETPGRISTINGIGRTFHGKAERCATCGSVVRTLWWTLVRVNSVLSILFSWRTEYGGFRSDEAVRQSQLYAAC
jgi:hypothetical protein